MNASGILDQNNWPRVSPRVFHLFTSVGQKRRSGCQFQETLDPLEGSFQFEQLLKNTPTSCNTVTLTCHILHHHISSIQVLRKSSNQPQLVAPLQFSKGSNHNLGSCPMLESFIHYYTTMFPCDPTKHSVLITPFATGLTTLCHISPNIIP